MLFGFHTFLSLFIGLGLFSLTLLLLVELSSQFTHHLLIFLGLLADEHLDLFGIGGLFFVSFLGKVLLLVEEWLVVASLSFLEQVDWVIIWIVWDVIRVLIMISQLNELVATLLFLLLIKNFHIFVDLILLLQGQVGLVLQVSSPLFLLDWLVVGDLCTSLNEVVVALALLWDGVGAISLIGCWNIVTVVIVVFNLNHRVIVVVRISVSMMSLLSIVAFVVLMEETIEVAVGGQLSVVKFLVVVANSLHIFRSVNNLWIVWRLVVSLLESSRSMDTLVHVVELEPLCGVLLWITVGRLITMLGSHGVTNLAHRLMSVLMMISKVDIGISLQEDRIVGSSLFESFFESLFKGLFLVGSVSNSDGTDLAEQGQDGERKSFHVIYYNYLLTKEY